MKTNNKLLTISPEPIAKMTAEPLLRYQAKGIVEGKVTAVGDSFRVQIGSGEYKLMLGKQKKRGFRQLVENSDEPIVMQVCPVQFAVGDLRFFMSRAIAERPAENTINRLILRGIWQYLSFSEQPLFSIYRSELKSEQDRYQPNHISVIWAGQPAHQPGSGRAYFSQIIAHLDPLSGNLMFESEIAPPSQPIPIKCFRYLAPPKLKNKAAESSDLTA
jgi:hypothetical protein